MPITKKTPIEKIIKDFVDSDDPRFQGKSREERMKMAKGTYFGLHKESQMLSFKDWLSESSRQ